MKIIGGRRPFMFSRLRGRYYCIQGVHEPDRAGRCRWCTKEMT